MDIVRSLELESFILTKLTKPFVPLNLVGPQVSLPSGGSLLSGGGIIIFCVIRRHFLAAAMDPAVSLSTYITLPMEVGR